MTHWHIITPEFPPRVGGVADYSQQVAEALVSAGDCVDIWTTNRNGGGNRALVHTELGDLTPLDFCRLGKQLNAFPQPRRLLVQWCPHGFGWKSMNVAFCLWLFTRALQGDEIDLMVHEPFLSFREGSLAQDAAATVHRLMIMVLLQASRRVWVSIPAWKDLIKPYLLGRRVPIEWLPIPSNVPVKRNEQLISEVREKLAISSEVIIGHFGTYGRGVRSLLNRVLPPLLLGKPSRRLLLIGLNSDSFRQELALRNPNVSAQILSTGSLGADLLSSNLAICDLLVQPYPDGVSSRRTTVMAALAHGIPTVTTFGHLSETLWRQSQAVALAPATDPDALIEAVESVLRSQEMRKTLTERAQILYSSKFDLAVTVERLRAECIAQAG